MLQSTLFTHTQKQPPGDSPARNAQLLIQAGFVDQLTAGVYTYLPLGLRVIKKISSIIREEMDAIGGQEILMPALHPKKNWETTKRWHAFDVLFKTSSGTKQEYALGASHEEVVVPLAKKFITSYKDLPFAVYQIQTKFRDELRPKSGLLRTREFIMKDLYSFHETYEDFQAYYQKAMDAYRRVYARCGVEAVVCEAPGGIFTKNISHEFQVVTDAGEDTIVTCPSCAWSKNIEIDQNPGKGDTCPQCAKHVLEEKKAIEAGNIFDLGQKYTDAFAVTYRDKAGKQQVPFMGCYGIGVSRLFGTIAEAASDAKGLVWPLSVAPFPAHLLILSQEPEKKLFALRLGRDLAKKGIEMLIDDRDVRPGQKFNDADLIGIPYRVVVGDKTGNAVEIKARTEETVRTVSLDELEELLTKNE